MSQLALHDCERSSEDCVIRLWLRGSSSLLKPRMSFTIQGVDDKGNPGVSAFPGEASTPAPSLHILWRLLARCLC